MKKSYLFFIGLGVEIVALVIPQKYPTSPEIVWDILLIAGLILIGFAIFLWIKEWLKK